MRYIIILYFLIHPIVYLTFLILGPEQLARIEQGTVSLVFTILRSNHS